MWSEEKIKNMDVLLSNSPFFRFFHQKYNAFPLGLGYLAAALKKNHIKTLIYNADYDDYGRNWQQIKLIRRFLSGIQRITNSLRHMMGLRKCHPMSEQDCYFQEIQERQHPAWNDFTRTLKLCNPKVLGISSTVMLLPGVAVLTAMAKTILPDLKIIVGGAAASTMPDKLMQDENIDYLIMHEGDVTIVELVQSILSGQDTPEVLQNIPGIVFRNGTAVVKNAPRALVENLDDLPFPDRNAMFYLDRAGQVKPLILAVDILSSRGCPFGCKFCACHATWNARKTRFRSNDNIINELRELHEKYHQDFFIFWDDLFTANKNKVLDLCDKINAANLKIKWICLAHLNTIDLEILQALKCAGCVEIQVGIESGNDRVLKYIGKQLTKAVIREKVGLIKQVGIAWRAFFIIGFPSETKEEIMDSIFLAQELKPSAVDYSVFSPYPGSVFYEELKKNNALTEDVFRQDIFNIDNRNYTGTMTDEEFHRLVKKAVEI